MRVVVAFSAFCVCLFFSPLYAHPEKPARPHDPLAVAFGSLPAMTGLHLSPDGSKISFLTTKVNDLPVLMILDMKSGHVKPALMSVPGKFDISWCEWANDERLLCGFSGSLMEGFYYIPFTRLVAVNADGGKMKVLIQNTVENKYANALLTPYFQYEDRVLDWLPDDSKHVLVQVPGVNGTGVSKVDIYSGSSSPIMADREGVYSWLSDGHGSPRLFEYYSENNINWFFRQSDDSRFHSLHEGKTTDDEKFKPVGFGENLDELLIFKPLGNHVALWAEDLRHNLKDRLVYAAPEADVDDVIFMGKYRRMVAVSYSGDNPQIHFFDYALEMVINQVKATFPGKLVEIKDESWDQKFYLVKVSSDQDPGAYYVFNTENPGLAMISPIQQELAGRQLAEMKPVQYPAADGTKIPAYLTLPAGQSGKGLPVIILPHGGPTARDDWGFDWLAQFLAAKGYAVLQSNYRGSAGYGKSWEGENAFHGWRKAIADINDGAKWLIVQGIADPQRICILGGSYGGYAALMGSIEAPGLYRCVVSIAGVTDPQTLIRDYDHFIEEREVRSEVGTEDEVIRNGSPLRRVKEFAVPVLMFHGEKDINVAIRHSEKMDEALRKAGKSSELVTYPDVEHHFLRNAARIDMLDRIGVFLGKYLAPAAIAAPTK